MLELKSLKDAARALDKAIAVIERKMQEKVTNSDVADEIEVLKAGVIQNFEMLYEQSWKMMKRWLNENISSQIADGVTRRELYRLAAENRLIVDIEKWMYFHKARNSSSHIYDGDVAEDVFNAACAFYPFAADLMNQLEQNND